MEIEELEAYEEATMTRINQPKIESMKHIQRYLQPLGLTVKMDHPVCFCFGLMNLY